MTGREVQQHFNEYQDKRNTVIAVLTSDNQILQALSDISEQAIFEILNICKTCYDAGYNHGIDDIREGMGLRRFNTFDIK